MPVCLSLKVTVRSRRSWISVINECYIVPNENAFLDCNAFANEGVAGDFTTGSNPCALLDFNKSANFRFVANLAPIKIYESADPNISSKLHVRSYQLMSQVRSRLRRRVLSLISMVLC